MRYSEIDLFGIYVAPIVPMMLLAWLAIVPLRWAAARFGLWRFVWHPALFGFAVYVVVLGAVVLLAGRERLF